MHRSAALMLVVAAPLLAGCTGPASDGMDGEAGFVGHRVEVVTRFSAEDYPDERHEEADMADGAPAREGVATITVREPKKDGDPPTTHAGCESSACEEGDTTLRDTYQVPMEKGSRWYPLGSDGRAVFYFAGDLLIRISIDGRAPGPDDDCGDRIYFSEMEEVETEPPTQKDSFERLPITQDIEVTAPFAANCANRFAS